MPDVDRKGRSIERIYLGPLDPARTARDEAHRRAAAGGRVPKKAEVDAAARRALHDLHHRYHRDVGAVVGLAPVGAEVGGRSRTDAITHAASRAEKGEIERLRAENDRLRAERLIEDRLLVAILAASRSAVTGSGAAPDPRREREVAIARRGLAAVQTAAHLRMGDAAEHGILLADGSVQLIDPSQAGGGRIRLSLLRSVEEARGDYAAISKLLTTLAQRDRDIAAARAERDAAEAELHGQTTALERVVRHVTDAYDLAGVTEALRIPFPDAARILDATAAEVENLRSRPSRDELAASAAETNAVHATLRAVGTASTSVALRQALEPVAPAAADLVRRLETERDEALARPTAADLAGERERARASAERALQAEARAQALEAHRVPANALATADTAAKTGDASKAAAALRDAAPSLAGALLRLSGRPETGDKALGATRQVLASLRSAGHHLDLDEAGHLQTDGLRGPARDRLVGSEDLAALLLAHEAALRRPANLDTALDDTIAVLQSLIDRGHLLRLGPDGLLDAAHLPAEAPRLLAGRERGAAILVAHDEALARPTHDDLRAASEAAASKARTQVETDLAEPLTAALRDLDIGWQDDAFEAAARHLRTEREAASRVRASLDAVTAERDKAQAQARAWSSATSAERQRITAAAKMGGLVIEPGWTWGQTVGAIERHLSRPRPAPPPSTGTQLGAALDGLANWGPTSLRPEAADLVAQVLGRLRSVASGSAPDWPSIRVPAALGPPAPIVARPLPPPPTETVALAVLEAAAARSGSQNHRDMTSMIAAADSPTGRAAYAAREWARQNPHDLQVPDAPAKAARNIGAATMPAAARARAERIVATSAEQVRDNTKNLKFRADSTGFE